MPAKDYRSTEVINFLKECYERESARRQVWAAKNKENLYKYAQFKKEPKYHFDTDIRAAGIKGEMAIAKRDFISSGRNRFHERPNDGQIQGIEAIRHGHSIADVGLGDPEEDPRLVRKDELTSEPIMRPVKPGDKKLLYQNGQGRTEYLEKRVKVQPEKRYYFPECSSWEYGWRLKDYRYMRGPWHPKYAELMRILNTRVGPTPDPPHYKSTSVLSFCH